MKYFLLNFFGCLAIHVIAMNLFYRRRSFKSDRGLFREFRWERSGRLYHALGVRRWKDRLPNLGSFDKKRLAGAAPGYLERFIQETCRGEAIHVAAIVPFPLFFLFNPPLGAWIVALYLILTNAPCAIAQRYNRIRLRRLLAARHRAGR